MCICATNILFFFIFVFLFFFAGKIEIGNDGRGRGLETAARGEGETDRTGAKIVIKSMPNTTAEEIGGPSTASPSKHLDKYVCMYVCWMCAA